MSERRLAVVDDDVSIRESLPALLLELGYAVRVYSSAEEFLGSGQVEETDCLILDIFLIGMSGPEMIRELGFRGTAIPTIYITANTDDALRDKLLEQGAVDCLCKPFSDTALLKALSAAFRVDQTDSSWET